MSTALTLQSDGDGSGLTTNIGLRTADELVGCAVGPPDRSREVRADPQSIVVNCVDHCLIDACSHPNVRRGFVGVRGEKVADRLGNREV